jgi:dynein heavy chain
MREYYAYWERRIFESLTHLIVVGMTDFQRVFASRGATGTVPLILIKAEMNPPLVVVSPSRKDIESQILKMRDGVSDSAKSFVRWMRGWCLECEPQKLPGREEEAVPISFHPDIIQSPTFKSVLWLVNWDVLQVIFKTNRHLDQWDKYISSYHLWDSKKVSSLEQIRKRPQPTSFFDKHLDQLTRLGELVEDLPHNSDIDFIRIECFSLIVAVKQKADEWIGKYGEILRDLAYQQLLKTHEKMASLDKNLDHDTTGTR